MGRYVESGIIDPVKVTRQPFKMTASVASLILTTEAVVADKPERKGSSSASYGSRNDGLLRFKKEKNLGEVEK